MDSLEPAAATDEPGGSVTEATSKGRAPKQRRNRISISVINFCLDAVLLAMVVSIGWVSGVLRFVFPAPTTADGWKLWGWNYDAWSDFQFGCLCALALGVLVHVMLHWNWVCSVLTAQIFKTRQRIDDSMQTIYGVGLLIVLLHVILFGIIAAKYSVVKPPM